jgi:hypothetical protein
MRVSNPRYDFDTSPYTTCYTNRIRHTNTTRRTRRDVRRKNTNEESSPRIVEREEIQK